MTAPPISIKGVVLHQGRVLLLVNDRNEWDLPGGRPDGIEDHRAALAREFLEETGLVVEIEEQPLGEHLFQVLPGRFVRIVAYACALKGDDTVTVGDEHQAAQWMAVADLYDGIVAGHRLPAGYLNAIKLATARLNAARSSS